MFCFKYLRLQQQHNTISKDPKSKTPSINGGKCQSPLAVPVKVSNFSVERQAFREVNRSKAKARVKQGNAFSQVSLMYTVQRCIT